MANIVGCEVISLESYYKSEQVKDFKYDDVRSLDLALLTKVLGVLLCNGILALIAYPKKYKIDEIFPVLTFFCSSRILLISEEVGKQKYLYSIWRVVLVVDLKNLKFLRIVAWYIFIY